MGNPENVPSIDDLLGQIYQGDEYASRLVGKGLWEIYKSGKYGFLPIPVGSSVAERRIEAVHMAAVNPGENIDLLEFIPMTSDEHQAMLEKQLRAQLAAFDPLGEISDDQIRQAPNLLEEEGLHVFGAFQLGLLGDGRRTTEIVFPIAFARLTHSYALAATLSAAFVRYAQ